MTRLPPPAPGNRFLDTSKPTTDRGDELREILKELRAIRAEMEKQTGFLKHIADGTFGRRLP